MGNTNSQRQQRPSSVQSNGNPALPAASAKNLSNNSAVSLMDSYASRPKNHVKCRNCTYPRNPEIVRCDVPDEQRCWSVPYEEYAPCDYTAPSVAGKPVWADIDYKNEEDAPQAAWNTLDGNVDRRSHMGPYEIIDKLPRNPVGRTGVCSRGLLGRWGPNHAADAIVTRWKRDASGNIVKEDNKPVLQFIAIQRRDSGEWALPGGMVDPGELVSTTLKREFLEEALDVANMSEETEQQVKQQVNEHFKKGQEGMVSPGEAVSLTLKREFSEETMNSLEVNDTERKRIFDQVHEMFQNGTEVYRGYVDDPRNSDNAWMETVAVNFHDESGKSVGQFKLNAGDDAVGVQWSDMHTGLSLYASHMHFISQVAKIHDAFW